MAQSPISSSFSVLGGGGFGYRSADDTYPLFFKEPEEGNFSKDLLDFSWSAGFRAGQRIGLLTWMETGILVVSTAYSRDFISVFQGSDRRPPFRNVNLQEFVKFRQVEVPVIFRHEGGLKRFRGYGEAGVTFEYLGWSRRIDVDNIFTRGDPVKTDLVLRGPSRLGIGGVATLGLLYGVGSKYEAFSQISYRKRLSALKVGAGITDWAYPASLILEIGMRKLISKPPKWPQGR